MIISIVIVWYIFVFITIAVGFYNFKSRKFKLSVSNPKNKYVAYVSVLSQISNCQSLGRKNEHDILKTDHTITVTTTITITITFTIATPTSIKHIIIIIIIITIIISTITITIVYFIVVVYYYYYYYYY